MVLRLRGGSGLVKHVTSSEQLDQIIHTAGNKLVLIDFSATWCGPCQYIAPKFATMSEQNTDVVFVKVSRMFRICRNDASPLPSFSVID